MTYSFPTRRSSDLLVERAVHDELHELLGDHRLGVEAHRQVRVLPVADHAEALELLALDIDPTRRKRAALRAQVVDRNRSEEHTSELQSLMRISYAVFCLKKQHRITIYITT